MAQTTATQFGPDAVAHPPVDVHVDPLPQQYHFQDDAQKHTSETQMGPNAIAPPADHMAEDENDLVFHNLPPFPEVRPPLSSPKYTE